MVFPITEATVDSGEESAERCVALGSQISLSRKVHREKREDV